MRASGGVVPMSGGWIGASVGSVPVSGIGLAPAHVQGALPGHTRFARGKSSQNVYKVVLISGIIHIDYSLKNTQTK